MESEESVLKLINKLCICIYNDSNYNNANDKPTSKFLKTCKKFAFEILLKKSAKINNKYSETDPFLDLHYFKFEMAVTSENFLHRKFFSEFSNCLDCLSNAPYFLEPVGKAILVMLIQLKDSTEENTPKNSSEGCLLGNLYFKNSAFKTNPYEVIDIELMRLPKTYLDIFEKTSSDGNPYIRKSGIHFNNQNCSQFFNLLNISDTFATNPFINKALGPQNLAITHKLDEKYLIPSNRTKTTILQPYQSKNNTNKSLPLCSNFKWDNLGVTYYVQPERQFSSENCQALHHLISMQSHLLRTEFNVYIISFNQFITDVKSLITGGQSECFTFDENELRFAKKSNVTINNVLCATIDSFIEEFLECGTCFKRLQLMITKEVVDFTLKCDGFVFKTLCNSIEKYLTMFRQYVYNIKDTTILQLSKRMSLFFYQIKMLTKILFIHPDASRNRMIPKGSEFLGYLYKEIIEVTQKDVAMLFVYILQQCCHVYFCKFEKWIFYGFIDDPCKELFIEFIDHYRPNTKPFWDKSYLIKRQSVPGFLQGYEDITLLCGKYTMLLKTFKPTHPLLFIAPPSIQVCLTFPQLQKMQNDCSAYVKKAQEICGEAVTVDAVFKQKSLKKEAFLTLAAEKFRENLANWKIEQVQKAEDAKLKKEIDRKILQQQIAEVRQKKIQERLENLAIEREYLRMEQDLEDKRVIKENIQRQKTIDYYTELGEIIDAQHERAEAASTKLRLQLRPVDSHDGGEGSEKSISPEYQTPRGESSDERMDEVEEQNQEKQDEQKEKKPFDAEKYESDKETQEKENKEEDIYHSAEKLTVDSTEYELDPSVQNENYDKVSLKKSASDYFNSNVVEQNTLAQNKIKILGTTFNFKQTLTSFTGCGDTAINTTTTLSIAQQNKLKSLGHSNVYDNKTYNQGIGEKEKDGNFNEVSTNVLLSDRKKNKLKVLGQEFAIVYNVPQINIVPIDNAPKELTDLERNRIKCLTEEYGFSKQKSVEDVSQHLSDVEKNKMNSEKFDYISEETSKNTIKASMSLDFETEFSKNKRLSEDSSICTPMSTGSDTPLLSDRIDEDIQNANTTEPLSLRRHNNNGNLKINTTNKIKSIPKYCGIPATASDIPSTTPESALNTVGLLAKDGFVFNFVPTYCVPLSQPIYVPDNDKSTCISSFLPSVKTGFFTMPNKIRDPVAEGQMNAMKNMNITTITHFLKMSFVVPMQAHLQVLNNEILKMYLLDFDILSHFKSLRNYFFMMDGEFASHICDGLISKLEEQNAKPIELLNFYVLHSLLDNALCSSIIGNDKNAENLSFIVDDLPDRFDLSAPNVLKELNLTYAVEWPLNLLLNPETILHYAKIFQHLIKLRRISWVLDQCFQMLKEIAKQTSQHILKSPQYGHVQQIRHKLLSFVNALQNHITSNALQASWVRFKQDLSSVKSMEDIYQKHTKYLKRVEFLCMLNKSSYEFYIKLEDIFIIVLRFYHKLKARQWKLNPKNKDEYIHGNFSKFLTIENDFEKLIKYIIHAGSKMSRRGYQTEIEEFINLINYNCYYTSSA